MPARVLVKGARDARGGAALPLTRTHAGITRQQRCTALQVRVANGLRSDSQSAAICAILAPMQPVSVQRIGKAIRIVARLIDMSGDAYWPILERLEAELAALASREEHLARYCARERPQSAQRLLSSAARSVLRARPAHSG
jgi:hypothetical protein